MKQCCVLQCIGSGWVGLDRVGLRCVVLRKVGLCWVGLRRVGLGWHGFHCTWRDAASRISVDPAARFACTVVVVAARQLRLFVLDHQRQALPGREETKVKDKKTNEKQETKKCQGTKKKATTGGQK